MKFTLAVVLIVFASRGAGAARGQQPSPPPAPQAAAQPSGAEAIPQQAPTHATTSERCASGKDRSAAAEPAQQASASAPATKAPCLPPGKAAVKVTGSRNTKAHRHTVAKEQPV